MNEAKRTAKQIEQREYAREHRFAIGFLNMAAADYGASRCSILNIEASGFQLGAQAIEKTIKGILLELDPAFKPKDASHGLKSLNRRLRDIGSPAAIASDDQIDRFMAHYNDRYPKEDGSSQVGSFSTSEIEDLDEIMLHLVVNEPDVPTRYRCGVGARLHDLATTGTPGPRDRWIIEENAALMREAAVLLPKVKEAFLLAPATEAAV